MYVEDITPPRKREFRITLTEDEYRDLVRYLQTAYMEISQASADLSHLNGRWIPNSGAHEMGQELARAWRSTDETSY